MPTTPAIRIAHSQAGAHSTAGTNTASSSRAVKTRLTSGVMGEFPGMRSRCGLHLFAGAAKAAFTGSIGGDRHIQCRRIKFGPQRVGEIQFGVGQLPQQEIADALLAAGADEEVGFGHVGQTELLGQRGFAHRTGRHTGQDQFLHRLHDVPAATVIGGHGKGEARVVARQRLGIADQGLDALGKTRQFTNDPEANVVFVEPRNLVFQRAHEQFHQQADFFLRAPPVFGTEREYREMGHPTLGAGADHSAQRLNPLAMPRHTRHQPVFCPAPIAVHDDRDVPGDSFVCRNRLLLADRHAVYARLTAQTASRSFSLSASILSISPMNLSVSFCTSSWVRRSSSSVAVLALTMSLSAALASRRMLRTATRAPSASLRTTLIRSLRRSSVNAGIGTRMMSPWVAGFRPRSPSRIAFSILPTMFFSYGCTPSVRESTSETFATCGTGVGLP